MDGEEKVYYENGQIWCVTPVQDGKEEGIAKEYDKSGKLIKTKQYAKGVCLQESKP